MHLRAAVLAVVAALLTSCTNGNSNAPVPTTPAATATAQAIVLHWMSWSSPTEPRYRLLYEGGEGTPFSELRLVGPDGAIVANGLATPSAGETVRMCAIGRGGEPTTYGPIRVTLVLSAQKVVSDVVGHPDTYRVEVFMNATWQRAQLIETCHVQVD